jgi:hypothetical protein
VSDPLPSDPLPTDPFPTDADARFLVLALRHLDGIASPEEKRLLAEHFRSDAALRRRYVLLCHQIASLHEGLPAWGERAGLPPGDGRPAGLPSLPGTEAAANAIPSTGEPQRERELSPPVPVPLPPTTGFGWLWGHAASAYTIAAVLLGAGLLVSRAWDPSNGHSNQPAESAKAQTKSPLAPGAGGSEPVGPKPVGPEPVPGDVARLAGRRHSTSTAQGPAFVPQGPALAAQGAVLAAQSSVLGPYAPELPAPGDSARLIGQTLTRESGLRRIRYRSGAMVTLQGPFKFSVPSDGAGGLDYGKATVRVDNNCNYFLGVPFVTLICSGGEFGIDLDRAGDGWLEIFAGQATVWLHEKGMDATSRIVLGEGELAHLKRIESGTVATVIHDAGLAASLAKRLPPHGPRPAGAPAPAEAAFVRDRGPAEFSGNSPGPTDGPAADDGSGFATVFITHNSAAGHGGTSATMRTRFILAQFAPNIKVADLVPGRSTLQLRFVARTFVVCAIRLNGRSLPMPAQSLDGAVCQIGALVVRDGFFGGDRPNELEFDLRSADPRQFLPEGSLAARDSPLALSLEVWVPPSSLKPPTKPVAADGGAKERK